MITDTHVGMTLGKRLYLTIHHLKECRTLSCIRSREMRRDKGETDGGVRYEEMTVDGLVTSRTTF